MLPKFTGISFSAIEMMRRYHQNLPEDKKLDPAVIGRIDSFLRDLKNADENGDQEISPEEFDRYINNDNNNENILSRGSNPWVLHRLTVFGQEFPSDLTIARSTGFDFTIPEGEFKFYSGMEKKVVMFKIQGVDVVVPEPPKDIKNKLDQIQVLLRRFPPHLLSNLKQIVLDQGSSPDNEAIAKEIPGGRVPAAAIGSSIHFCDQSPARSSPGDDFLAGFPHELGHVVHYGINKTDPSINFNQVWKQAQEADGNPVSEYAETRKGANLEEDFADFFRDYFFATNAGVRSLQELEAKHPNRFAILVKIYRNHIEDIKTMA